ncbi:3467_t:CDS:2, partial [Funneliformis mosseae]
PNHWSLVDFDLWAISNVAGVQQKIAHQAFYKYLNRVLDESSTQEHIMYARRLLNNKKRLIATFYLITCCPLLIADWEGGQAEILHLLFANIFALRFLASNHVANTLSSFLHVGKENIKSIRNLWKNKAVLGKVNQAVEMVKAHNMLDRVTKNRVEELIDYEMRVSQLLTVDLLYGIALMLMLVQPQNDKDDENPFLDYDENLLQDDVNKENETGVSGDNFPDFGRQMKKRRTEWLSTPHKPILTLDMFDIMIPKVVPGMKSLKKVVAEKFFDIANEIEYHEREQKQLTSLGKVLSEWLRKVLSSFDGKELPKHLSQPLQDLTNREQKLRDIFETTLQEFFMMIKHCQNHRLPRHNSERKFLVERVITPFKLVEYMFGDVTMFWIEKEIMSTKAVEFVDDPTGELTIKRADALGIDLVYNTDVMNMESSGGPLQQNRKHTLGDSKKITDTGADILYACLRKYLDASIETAMKLKTYKDRITLIEISLYKPRVFKAVEVRSAVFPFALRSVGEYMRVFELISYFVDGLIKRREIMYKLSNEASGLMELTSESLKNWWGEE